ncbi:MAG TPA: type II toxin-antitoxin system PemK/MazF family toxin [Candidatus Paceibacterota bacterium]
MFIKDFDGWNIEKKRVHSEENPIYFREGDIWWCKLGVNIGDEQDGKGENFSRPILIIKKFNQFIFWAVPLSSKLKKNKYYVVCKSSEEEDRAAIISQVKLVSIKRLTDKIGFADKKSLETIKKAIKELL